MLQPANHVVAGPIGLGHDDLRHLPGQRLVLFLGNRMQPIESAARCDLVLHEGGLLANRAIFVVTDRTEQPEG